MAQSFKKHCFANALDDKDNNTVWKSVCTGNFPLKIDTGELDSEWEVVSGIG